MIGLIEKNIVHRYPRKKYEYGKTGKGPKLKLDKDYKLVKHIEEEIVKNKRSPEVVSKQLNENGYDIKISGKTIRNAIKSGLIFDKIKHAHPYCSGERGTNENNNRMIRRWIPKGTDMTNIKISFIRKIETWINNYPRAMFDYKSSNMILLEQ